MMVPPCDCMNAWHSAHMALDTPIIWGVEPEFVACMTAVTSACAPRIGAAGISPVFNDPICAAAKSLPPLATMSPVLVRNTAVVLMLCAIGSNTPLIWRALHGARAT